MSARVGSIATKVVRSYLTEEWQSTDEICRKCPGMTRSAVQEALRRLWMDGFAVRRLDPTRTARIHQYKLPGAIE